MRGGCEVPEIPGARSGPGLAEMDERPGSEARNCRRLLPSVSRTFALTIAVLPSRLRDSVTVAYLLCRLADLLEDATGADPRARIEGLDALARALSRSPAHPPELSRCLDGALRLNIADPASAQLLSNRLCVFRSYTALPPAERDIVGCWVSEMAAGMAGYVSRELLAEPEWGAGAASAGGREAAAAGEPAADVEVKTPIPFVLETVEDLRAYAFFVAGTVGHLLTELFTLHLGRKTVAVERLRELAVPFGLGLQFTNILQDLAEDRRRGWSYVPEELARRHGTSARLLDEPRQRPAALRVVGDLVKEATFYLDGAMEYALLLPRRAPRIRLFCLWPIFFALRTLVRVWGEERVLTGGEKVRITRDEVRRVMRSTVASCFWNGGLDRLYRKERARLERRIALRPV